VAVDQSVDRWNNIADDWISSLGQNVLRDKILIPQTLNLLGDVSGKVILDLGCGEGGYSRLLAKTGGIVTGVDGSARLIEAAKHLADIENVCINYEVKNAANLEEIGDDTFDIILCAMSLMVFEDFDGALAEMSRVLKKDGQIVISILHPCFSGYGVGWQQLQDRTAFVADNYFSEEAWEEKLSADFKKEAIFWHKPLQDIINPFLGLGLKLVQLLEVNPPEELAHIPVIALQRRVPMFMFLQFTK